MLPLELVFGYLENISNYFVLNVEKTHDGKEPEMLNAIVKPLTDAIIQIDKAVFDAIASNKLNVSDDRPLIKRCTKINPESLNLTFLNHIDSSRIQCYTTSCNIYLSSKRK
jgi:hypothetical protein